jgi:hypothetical protein
MELDTTKYELIQWIVSLNDLSIIQRLKSMKTAFQEEEEDLWDTLTIEEQQGLEEAIASLDRGEGISGESAWARINSKFKG